MKNSINCELISGLEELDEIVVKNELENSFVLGMFADNLITGYWNSVKLKLIEEDWKYELISIRIFNQYKEIKVYRKNKNLFYRILTDNGEFYDEKQYLDIDTKLSKDSSNVIATGGGKYTLPTDIFASKDDLLNAGIIIRIYINYYASGQAYISDWRIVGFEKGAK